MFIEESPHNIPEQNNEFTILLSGYEGPIDLLLDLAKKQKVDLSEISILELAEQYIDFIEKYKKIHLEIAADYLVMAAWLTYLKSRLLLPKEKKEDEYSSDELEEALKYQLQRLEAMQNVSKKLYSKSLIGRDVFYGNSEEGINIKYTINYVSTLYDLLKSYSYLISQKNISNLTINLSELQTVEQSIERLKSIFGSLQEWTNFINIIPKFGIIKVVNKSYISSNFVASLELTKNNLLEMQQENTFGEIFIRTKQNGK